MNNQQLQVLVEILKGLVKRRFPGLTRVRVYKGFYSITSRKAVGYPGERGPPLPGGAKI